MKRSIKAIALIMMLVAALSVLFIPSKVYAAGSDTAVVAETNDKDVTVAKAYAAAIVVAAVAAAGARQQTAQHVSPRLQVRFRHL